MVPKALPDDDKEPCEWTRWKENVMEPFQFALYASGSQTTLPAQLQNKLLVFRPYWGGRRIMRLSALVLQVINALGLIPPPFRLSRARDGATPTNKTGVSRLLVKFHPLKALPDFFFH